VYTWEVWKHPVHNKGATEVINPTLYRGSALLRSHPHAFYKQGGGPGLFRRREVTPAPLGDPRQRGPHVCVRSIRTLHKENLKEPATGGTIERV